MLDRLAHRGPDSAGERQVGDAWLGHRRLATVDLEGGGQRLGSSSSGRWLVGDGEIYNHRRLREALGPDRFASRSQHEPALHLYEDVGIQGFERLWGTFALAI